ncbi:CPBP family intramembrane glutamic endopeptidase [Frateuria aurantia]
MPDLAATASAPPPAPTPQPAPLQAIGTVLAYFALQLLLGLPLYPLLRWLQTQPGLTAQGWSADLLLWATCLDLLVASLLMLFAIHRWWPRAWPRGDAQGLGFVPASWRQCLLGALVGLTVIPLLGSWITDLLAHGDPITEQIDVLITNAGRWARLPMVVLTITLVPLVEETLFRGVLLSALRSRCSRGVAIGITSAAFAVAHLGSFDYQWYALPALGLFALALAELRVRTGSIWPGVLAHACNNLLAIIAILSP